MVGLFRGMVFCLVLAAAGVAFAAQTQPSSTPQQKVAKQETRLGAEKSNENKDDENIAIQRKLAKFTFWLVVVGFIQAAILAATVCVIWKQISIARNIERAWVMADIEHDSQKWTDRKVHMLHRGQPDALGHWSSYAPYRASFFPCYRQRA